MFWTLESGMPIVVRFLDFFPEAIFGSRSIIHFQFIPSDVEYKIFCFVINQSSLSLTKFIKKNINI